MKREIFDEPFIVPAIMPMEIYKCTIDVARKDKINPTEAILSHNNPCFQCNIAITIFLVSHTFEIRFNDVIGQNTVPMYSYAKIPKHGLPTWRNEYVLEPYFLI